MAPSILLGFGNRVPQHVLGRVDPNEMDVGRIGVERDSGADPDFEYPLIS
jgi:hypothetical protein